MRSAMHTVLILLVHRFSIGWCSFLLRFLKTSTSRLSLNVHNCMLIFYSIMSFTFEKNQCQFSSAFSALHFFQFATNFRNRVSEIF